VIAIESRQTDVQQDQMRLIAFDLTDDIVEVFSMAGVHVPHGKLNMDGIGDAVIIFDNENSVHENHSFAGLDQRSFEI